VGGGMARVIVQVEIRKEFGATAPWPTEWFSREVEILLGLEELALHPTKLEMLNGRQIIWGDFFCIGPG
jgi:hypothetical protein